MGLPSVQEAPEDLSESAPQRKCRLASALKGEDL